MYEYLPCGCTPSHVDASDPFDDPIGLCACCAAHCFADSGALVLTNGVLCPDCISALPAEALADYIGAIAPATWSAEDIARTLAEIKE